MVLRVGDSGPGIPLADQARIFDSFVRGAQPGGTHGAGLGLALVRSFVRLHGGQVELISAPDQGTTVLVRLPTGRAV